MNHTDIQLDMALLDEMFHGIGLDTMRELVAFYVDETRARLPEMRRQLETGDFAELKRSAHSLKGASRTYGVITLAENAALLEKAADEADADVSSPHLAWIEQYAEHALGMLLTHLDGIAHSD